MEAEESIEFQNKTLFTMREREWREREQIGHTHLCLIPISISIYSLSAVTFKFGSMIIISSPHKSTSFFIIFHFFNFVQILHFSPFHLLLFNSLHSHLQFLPHNHTQTLDRRIRCSCCCFLIYYSQKYIVTVDSFNMAESVELPGRLAILPFRNKVLLPGAIIRIRCTSSSRYFNFCDCLCCFQNLDEIFMLLWIAMVLV